MALSDKVEELQRTVAALNERVNYALESVEELYDTHQAMTRELADLRREHERELALLKREDEIFRKWQDDQKKEQDEHRRRWWAFGPNAVGAVLSGLIAAAVAYFISRR